MPLEDEVMGTTVEDALSYMNWLPEGYLPTSAIVILSAVNPMTGSEELFIQTDTAASGFWKHVGMLEIAVDGLRYGEAEEDDE